MSFDEVRQAFADSFVEGKQSESVFCDIARKKGWKILLANEEEDKKGHWDYVLKKNEKAIKVDVKGRHRLQRHDKDFCDDYIQLELVNKIGYDGWLYGHADFVAFETEDCFIIVGREDLVKIVKSSVVDRFYERPTPYAKYHVHGTQGVVTLIDTEEVVECATFIWNKL